jgi:hypothetical protein
MKTTPSRTVNDAPAGILATEVWIFQDGHLLELLHFAGPLVATMPILMFCVAASSCSGISRGFGTRELVGAARATNAIDA